VVKECISRPIVLRIVAVLIFQGLIEFFSKRNRIVLMKHASEFRAFFDEAGFSLVQVMVAMGLAGGLAVYMMTLTENQLKNQKNIEMKAEIQKIDVLIRQTLRDKNNCFHTFKQAFPGGTLDGIRISHDPSVPYFAEVENRFKNTNVSIDEMYILKRSEEEDKSFNDGVKPIRSSSEAAVSADGTGKAHLRVTFSKGINADDKARFFGGKTIKKIYTIYAKFGKPILVPYCPADSATEKTKCENNPPPSGTAIWSSIEDAAHLQPHIGKACVGFGVSGYIGTCLHISPDFGIVSCVDPF
jgi:type II secretory pathway pseudopilin PulG